MTPTETLFDKYLQRAEAAFAKRDAQRCPPDPMARESLRLLNRALDRLSANEVRNMRLWRLVDDGTTEWEACP